MPFKLLVGFFVVLVGTLTSPASGPAPTDIPTSVTIQGHTARSEPTRCTLSVPDSPLSPRGLATPYVLAGPCRESDPNSNAFV